MTSEHSTFAARLREHILSEGRRAREPQPEISSQIGHSGNLSLRGDQAFNTFARELFALQFARNAAFRRICEARGVTPQSISHWSEIPAVPAAAFKELELTCIPPMERTHVFQSSGTTEQRPSRHFHNAESLAVYQASLWSWFEPHVLPDLEFAIHDLRLMILTPPPAQAPHSSLVHMVETVRRRLKAAETVFVGRAAGDGAWTLDFDAALASLRRDTEVLLLGTAFSCVYLLDFLREQKVRLHLPPGSRVMETGGYKGRSRTLPKPALHALITEQLGVPPSRIVCEYGMSELSSQAYDNVSKRMDVTSSASEAPSHHEPRPLTLSLSPGGGEASRRTGEGVNQNLQAERRSARCLHFPPWARAQVISPETGREVAHGETGLLRVFDLANVFSVMAIQTEDLGIRRGDGFELIGRAELAEPRGCSLMAV